MKRLLFLFHFLVLALTAWGQAVLSGRVVNEKGEALLGAMVKVSVKGNNTVKAYTQTNAQGQYRLEVASSLGNELTLRTSCLGYATAEKTIANHTATHNTTLKEQAHTFRSAVVKAPVVRHSGDTITYTVSSLKGKADRNIGDVISRIPGIEIDPSGAIKYQGERINRFYIEGLNLLGGRYGMATRNIRPDDVQSVDVLEHHQPQKVLQGIDFSHQAALNLNLKKSALMRPVGYLSGGGGTATEGDVRYLGEAYAMFIGSKRQSILTAKTNNFADDYRSETMNFIDASSNDISNSPLSDTPFGASSLANKRYRHNRTAYASWQTLFARDKEHTLRLNGTYAFGAQRFAIDKRSEYWTSTQNIAIDERVENALRQQSVDLTAEYEANTSTNYLSNKLAVNTTFQRHAYTLPLNAVVQRQRTNSVTLSNNTEWTHRRGQRLSTYHFSIGLSNTPYARLSAWQTPTDSLLVSQDIGTFTAFATARTRWRIGLGRNGRGGGLNLALTARATHETFESATATPLGTMNDNSFQGLTLSATPSYDVRFLGFSWTLALPIIYRHHDFSNHADDTNHKLHRPYISPTLEMFTKLFGGFLQLNTTYEHSVGGLNSFLTAPIYYSYRSQSILGTGQLSTSKAWRSGLTYMWRDTYRGRALNLTASYLRSTQSELQGSDIDNTGDETSANIMGNNISHQWQSRLRASAHCFPIHTNFAFVMGYSGSRSTLLRQSQRYSITSQNIRLEANTGTRLFYSTLQADGRFAWMRSFRHSTAGNTSLDNLSGSVSLSLFFADAWEVYSSVEWQRTELADAQFANAWFLDGGLRWKQKRIEVELRLRNLTNAHTYVQHLYALTDTQTFTTHLRPAEGLVSVKWNF